LGPASADRQSRDRNNRLNAFARSGKLRRRRPSDTADSAREQGFTDTIEKMHHEPGVSPINDKENRDKRMTGAAKDCLQAFDTIGHRS